MRCNECNVDLGEEYTKCPLCGAVAVNDEPHLKGIKTAEYPKYDESLLSEKTEYHTTFPQKYVFRVCSILSVCLLLCAYIGIKLSLTGFPSDIIITYAVPAIMTLSAIFYFAYSFKEKGRLLHSTLSLIATAVVLAIFAVVAAIIGSGLKMTLIALGICVILFAVVFAAKPIRVKEQLKATFKL